MAVTSSGVIRLSGDIVTEFGGTAPHGLTEYYRGAGIVTAGNTAVPTSGAIAFSDFYGTTATVTRDIRVQMTYSAGHTYTAFGVTSANSEAAPQAYSGSLLFNAFTVYSPVFRAGTGFLGQDIAMSMHQNEDAQPSSVTLFGGTSRTAVNDVVLQLNGGYNNSQGGSRSFTIAFDSNGGCTGITQTSTAINFGIITVTTNNPSTSHRFYQWRVVSPNASDKGSTLIQGDPTGFSAVTQPT